MVAFQIPDVKDFMGKFLNSAVFDNFLFVELDIMNYGQFHINGRRNRDWYDDLEWETISEKEYLTWKEIRPCVFGLVKGHKTPLAIKGVFLLSKENTVNILKRGGTAIQAEAVGGLFLNLRFERGVLNLVTGISLNTFTMDKTLERQWDEDVKVFLKHHSIAVVVDA